MFEGLESLGLVGDFFEKKDNPFGFKSFKHWLITTANDDFISEHFANNAEEILLHQQWKEEFVAKLTEYREA